ncbi:MAG: LysM peptidoglycan-binding domain-containing protein, partial [Chloroflexota bacterium]|nr:LysM peptidoglycan-binding domain-containing protein [Chloroflexota bacterium]
MYRSTRAALVALLLTVPLFVTGAHPAMAQAVIGVDNSNPLAPLPDGSPTAGEAAPTEDQPARDATPPAEAGSEDAEAETAAPLATPTTYVVQAKDTMFSIARRHGVSVDAILWANDLTDPNVLKQGQTLTIPPSSGTLYTVKAGDTLT